MGGEGRQMQSEFDNVKFRQVLGNYPTGVCAVTAVNDGQPAAMVVGSFTSVSLDPPLVGFFPDRSSTSWPKIEAAGRFCVNMLGAHQLDLCRVLASKSPDKFMSVAHRISANGSPILDGVLGWIDCDLHSVADAGDHYFVMGMVKTLEAEAPLHPLLFFRGGYGQFGSLTPEA